MKDREIASNDQSKWTASASGRRLSTRELKAVEMYRRGADLPAISRGLGVPAAILIEILGLVVEGDELAAAAGRPAVIDNPVRGEGRRRSFERADDKWSNPYVDRSQK